jgi:hypothetical protein
MCDIINVKIYRYKIIINTCQFVKQSTFSNHSTNIHKANNNLSVSLAEHKKRPYDIVNSDPGLGQTYTCGGVKPVNEI